MRGRTGRDADLPFRRETRSMRRRPLRHRPASTLDWIVPILSVWLCLAASVFLVTPARADAAPNPRPCDIYAAAGTPCVAAHSSVRALFAGYAGPLYRVKRASDGASSDIGLLGPGDYANGPAQDAFCAGTTCTVTLVYDQTPRHNDLAVEGKGGNGAADVGVPADALPVTAGGHPVYGLSFSGGMGYRDDATSGVAVNGQPESAYMVTSGTHANDLCCFDYGNAETDNKDDGNGHMDALNFGTACITPCTGDGPWVHADLENGLFMSDEGLNLDRRDRGRPGPYVTAVLRNNGQNYLALKSGDARNGALALDYAGPEPQNKAGYSPLHQEGAIVLGTGGDDSNRGIGSFFEGAMTAGVPSNTADSQGQADIVAVGYGGPTGLFGTLQPGSEVSLMTSRPNSSAYLRHQKNDGVQTVVTQVIQPWWSQRDRAAATWIVRRGFANQGCLSFESRDLPGAFLTHVRDVLQVQPADGTAAFAGAGTFCTAPGFDGQGTSFQSVDVPGEYVRVYRGLGFIASDGGPQPYDDASSWPVDVSFRVTPPLNP